MEQSNPYFVHKAENKDWFWCEKCKKHHKLDEALYFYNVCVRISCFDGQSWKIEEDAMNGCRSCSKEYAQELVNSFNERHNRIKEWSTRNGGKPILL